jgi:L-threonylcarbamoyladenylate synthase
MKESLAAGIIPFHSAAEIDRAVGAAVAYLRAGAVLAHPTETVYGLGGRIDDAGVEALAALKPRGPDQPFLVLIAAREMLDALGGTLPPTAAALAARYWPGPLTLIVPVRTDAAIPDRLRGPAGGIAVRWTSHPGMQRLIEAYGAPMTSTSANRTGVPPARTVGEIADQWGNAIEGGLLRILDGGQLGYSPASTIVDCTTPRPRLVRAGVVAVQELQSVAPDLLTQ